MPCGYNKSINSQYSVTDECHLVSGAGLFRFPFKSVDNNLIY